MSFKPHNGIDVCYPQHPKHKVWLKQKERWRHNGYQGSAMMMQKNALAMVASSTVTDEARKIAARIAFDAALLGLALKTRKDKA